MFLEKSIFNVPGNEIRIYAFCFFELSVHVEYLAFSANISCSFATYTTKTHTHALMKKRMLDVQSEIIPQHFVIFVIDFSWYG